MSGASYPSLRDRTVFITGGASGIGAAFTRAFHAQGARVAFVDIAPGEELAAQLPGSWFATCDVTRLDQLETCISDAAAALGPVTVLINNVANDQRHSAEELDGERWRSLLAVNLDHVFHAARLACPMMRSSGGGSIINLSSINALLGPANMPAYVAAKSAIIGLTKSLAREWGQDRIRVNAISPGWVVTERQLQLWLTPEAEAEWAGLVALKDRIQPDDVASLALFLASDDARMITGQNLVIDAGRT